MHLKRLIIRTLPGIEPGFTFEPKGDGINIVTGPNAIGKSSLARALGYLLRGGRKEDPVELSLEAELVSDDTTWRVRRNGSHVAWYRNGSAADKPALPGADQAALYRLSVENLLAGDDHDRDLAQELRNSLRGGFDLDALRIELSTRFAQNDEKNLRDAQHALRKAEEDYDTLEQQEREELPRLNREIEAAGDAREQLQRLQLGLDLDKAIKAKKSCAEELKDYPAGMERLRGDEQERLAKLEEKSQELQNRLRKQERLLHSAQTRFAETGFEQSGPDPDRLDAVELRLGKLVQKVESRNSAGKDLAQAEGGLKKARDVFNDAGKPPRLDEESIKQADTVAAPLIRKKAERNVLQLELDQAGVAPDDTEIDNLRAAGDALRAWLAANAVAPLHESTSVERVLRRALWVTLVISMVFIALLPGVLSILPGALATGLFCAVVWDWLFILRKRRRGTGVSPAQAKQRFLQTGLAEPPVWITAAVEKYLDADIDKRYRTLMLQRERAARAPTIRARLDTVDTELAQLQARNQEAAAHLGFDPECPGVKPDIFLQQCRQLLEAEDRYAQENARLEAVERDIAEDVAGISGFLSQWSRTGAPAPADTHEEQDINLLQASFQQLKNRVSDAADARKDVARHQDDILALRKDTKANAGEINALFSGCGLGPDAHSELDRRFGRLDEWRAKREALHGAQVEEKRIRALLDSHPEITRDVDEGKPAKLQNNFAMVSEQAGRYTELLQQQAEITTRLKDAGTDHKLSQARADLDSARATLQDKREEAWLFEATEVLLDDVEQTYQTEHVPPTFKRAQDLFKAITHGAFDLQLEKDGRFAAQDKRQGARRNLEQLSSGTRMQLLLALRLAWVEAQEQGGETLPLFLDEALTTSDEDRFAVMAKSLERLADLEGRQIFYLSARRHEYALWKQATGNEPPVIDLAEVRFPQQAHSPQDYGIAMPRSFPSPDGRNPEDYASALGVSLMDPCLDPGAAHLFHLLRDDLDLLYQLMDKWRITSLGQLEALLHSDAGPKAVTDIVLRDRLRQRCNVVRVWTELWRLGRGRLVDRIALEQSGAISDKFIDRVTHLAETVDGDGKALVQALDEGQVSGFRANKIKELERWLADGGYTDERDILTANERRRLTLQQAMSDASDDVEDANRVITWLESASP